MTISPSVKTIYILTEPTNYMSVEWRLKACVEVLRELQTTLISHFPRSVIGVRRGHQYDSMLQIAHAKHVVSTASTFSFWPMLCNTNGKLFFPVSRLIGGGDPHLFLAPNFLWLSYPDQLHFAKYRMHKNPQSLRKVIEDLKSVRPNTAITDVKTGG
eukprot:CAMPEP_0182439120 /NCGR_PEP_ID=MMETSP1167-20130531/86238_1 /TAXON_ID=2988 /ORGANISM="Mallomonas Sp, Strain CCMP3275" /LENGTH=156 /DNA_ID=CAMNT_0024632741 /DNA_START=953 /DNA_END=1423 /DNA_ORIENTATION=-